MWIVHWVNARGKHAYRVFTGREGALIYFDHAMEHHEGIQRIELCEAILLSGQTIERMKRA